MCKDCGMWQLFPALNHQCFPAAFFHGGLVFFLTHPQVANTTPNNQQNQWEEWEQMTTTANENNTKRRAAKLVRHALSLSSPAVFFVFFVFCTFVFILNFLCFYFCCSTQWRELKLARPRRRLCFTNCASNVRFRFCPKGGLVPCSVHRWYFRSHDYLLLLLLGNCSSEFSLVLSSAGAAEGCTWQLDARSYYYYDGKGW